MVELTAHGELEMCEQSTRRSSNRKLHLNFNLLSSARRPCKVFEAQSHNITHNRVASFGSSTIVAEILSTSRLKMLDCTIEI